MILTLNYAPSLIPRELHLWLEGNPDEIARIEVLNTTSGLGREIFNAGTQYSETLLVDHACTRILNIPIDVDFEVDTVFIAFNSFTAANTVDAVEVIGSADLFMTRLFSGGCHCQPPRLVWWLTKTTRFCR